MVGHSFGGASAATLATRYPERIASLSLFDPVVVVKPLRDRAFADIGGTTVGAVRDEGEAMTSLIDAASSGYFAALPTPRYAPISVAGIHSAATARRSVSATSCPVRG